MFSSLHKKMTNIQNYVGLICDNFSDWPAEIRRQALADLVKKKPMWTSLPSDVLTMLYALDKIKYDTAIDNDPAKLEEYFKIRLSETESSIPPDSSVSQASTAVSTISDSLDDNALLKKGILRVYTSIHGDTSRGIKISNSATYDEVVNIILKKFRIQSKPNFRFNLVCRSSNDYSEKFPKDQAPLTYIQKLAEKVDIQNVKIILERTNQNSMIRIYNDINPDQGFKTLELTEDTTCFELITKAHQKFKLPLTPSDYDLVEILKGGQRLIKFDEYPLAAIEAIKEKGSGEKVRYSIKEKAITKMEKMLTSAEVMEIVQCQAENSLCADCKAKNPTFVSINLGIVLCCKCAEVHSMLHFSAVNFLSVVRPIRFLTWKTGQLDSVKYRGNKSSNLYFGDSDLELAEIDTKTDSRQRYIEKKYMYKEFCSEEKSLSTKQLLAQLFKAIDNSDINLLIETIQMGSPVDQEKSGRLPPLHEVAILGNNSMFQILIAFGANPLLQDEKGRTALFYLYAYQNESQSQKLIEQQIFYEGLLHRKSDKDPNFFFSLQAFTKGLLTQTKLINLGAEEFKKLKIDTMYEIEKRSLDQIGLPVSSMDSLKGPAQKLSALTDLDLRELSDNVFDELALREFFVMHVKHTPKSRSSSDCSKAIQTVKIRQTDEKEAAKYFDDEEKAKLKNEINKKKLRALHQEFEESLVTAQKSGSTPEMNSRRHERQNSEPLSKKLSVSPLQNSGKKAVKGQSNGLMKQSSLSETVKFGEKITSSSPSCSTNTSSSTINDKNLSKIERFKNMEKVSGSGFEFSLNSLDVQNDVLSPLGKTLKDEEKLHIQVEKEVESIVFHSKSFLADILAEEHAKADKSLVGINKSVNDLIDLCADFDLPVVTKSSVAAGSKNLSNAMSKLMRKGVEYTESKSPAEKTTIKSLKIACYEVIKCTKLLVEIIATLEKQ